METKKRKKTGGRMKGSLNKTTSMTKSVIAELLGNYADSGMMSEDWKKAGAKNRLEIMTKMAQYVLPKMQNTNVDLTASVEKQSIIDLLNAESEAGG